MGSATIAAPDTERNRPPLRAATLEASTHLTTGLDVGREPRRNREAARDASVTGERKPARCMEKGTAPRARQPLEANPYGRRPRPATRPVDGTEPRELRPGP